MFNGACDAVPKRQRACSTGVFDVSIYLYIAYFMPSETLAMMQSTCTALFNMKLKLETLQRVPLWAFKQVCSPATLTHLVAGPQPTPRRVSAMIDAFSKLTTLELQNSPAGYFARNTRVVFPNLTTLDISNQDFSETFYLSTNAPRLTTLTMNNMKAQDGTALQNTFAHLPLTTLRAHGLDFQILAKKRVASHILKFPNTLTCLDLTKAKLDDRCQRDLERLVHLESLCLNACSHFDPIYLANLLRVEKLQRLYLDCLPMTREGVVALSRMYTLKRLSLYKVRGCVQFLINSLPRSLTELCICAPRDDSIIFDLPPSATLPAPKVRENTPIKPFAPVAPTAPTAPVAPITPVAPVTPVNPVTPVAPANPLAPLGPVAPSTPAGPSFPCLACPLTLVIPRATDPITSAMKAMHTAEMATFVLTDKLISCTFLFFFFPFFPFFFFFFLTFFAFLFVFEDLLKEKAKKIIF